ncbi:MAG: replication-associated recombination protein A [Candidatus Eisenbacteria bacterium]|nr:replication-associated recombination protein A [Candidatus Eisenbacteria bacterium]
MNEEAVGSGELFEAVSEGHVPLARRRRPEDLSEYVGQAHILAEGKLLRRAIETDRLFSMILYGPPGCGKTSLGNVIAGATRSRLINLNAVEARVSDLRAAVAAARNRLPSRTILFIDEVHRFNKAQQDVLLAPLENDVVTMMGATVENPFFYLNQAVLSRVHVFELKPLSGDEIETILKRSLSDTERGLGEYHVELGEDALGYLTDNALGDARRALAALELAVLSTAPDRHGVIRVGLSTVTECLRQRVVRYDRAGDSHYDVASAFIKSIRGSQPDAALHWMARMIRGGEDPRFIARRLVISASEDIGLADPRALPVAVAAARAVEMLGMPEAEYALTEAAIYLATAPKSRTCADAFARASEDIENGVAFEVPDELRDASYSGARRMGRGKGYQMPESESDGRSQRYMPEGRTYYRPADRGYEREVRERLKQWDSALKPASNDRDSDGASAVEGDAGDHN